MGRAGAASHPALAADNHGQRHRRPTRLSAGRVTAPTSLTTTRSQVESLPAQRQLILGHPTPRQGCSLPLASLTRRPPAALDVERGPRPDACQQLGREDRAIHVPHRAGSTGLQRTTTGSLRPTMSWPSPLSQPERIARMCLIRPPWPGAATRDENRVARPSSALLGAAEPVDTRAILLSG
jgi:hypothetical protein